MPKSSLQSSASNNNAALHHRHNTPPLTNNNNNNPNQVYEALDAVGVRADTTITNAAISACDKGGRWEAAVALFARMGPAAGLPRDAITYSAVLSALSKGRQGALAIRVFNGMVEVGGWVRRATVSWSCVVCCCFLLINACACAHARPHSSATAQKRP